MTKPCSELLDDLRDQIGKDTTNQDLWTLLITALRSMCKSVDDVQKAIRGNGDDIPGIFDILVEMRENQTKRKDDKFNFKQMLLEKVLPSVISALIIGFAGAVVGWWLAVNELLRISTTAP